MVSEQLTARQQLLALGRERVAEFTQTELAEQIGCTRARVQQIVSQLGWPTRAIHSRVDFDAIDWRLRNRDIAKKLGVGPSLVSTWRRRLKVGPADVGMGGIKYDWDSVDWSLPNHVIAEQVGASERMVSNTRLRLRRQGFDVPQLRRRRLNWSQVDWLLDNGEIAEQLDTSRNVVARKRRELRRAGKDVSR